MQLDHKQRHELSQENTEHKYECLRDITEAPHWRNKDLYLQIENYRGVFLRFTTHY